jgi:hypothetical protein
MLSSNLHVFPNNENSFGGLILQRHNFDLHITGLGNLLSDHIHVFISPINKNNNTSPFLKTIKSKHKELTCLILI